MSANVASDDPPEIGIVDHTINNGGPLYPIEVCEATIAVNETQNPESRHQRVKGSFLPLFSPFSLCVFHRKHELEFGCDSYSSLRSSCCDTSLFRFFVMACCLFIDNRGGGGGLKVTYGDSRMRFTRVTDHLWNTIYFNWIVSWLRLIAYVFRC